MCLIYLRLFLAKLCFCVPARVAINIKKLIFSARDDLVKVSWKWDARKYQNKPSLLRYGSSYDSSSIFFLGCDHSNWRDYMQAEKKNEVCD